jgi:hypothetical protein
MITSSIIKLGLTQQINLLIHRIRTWLGLSFMSNEVRVDLVKFLCEPHDHATSKQDWYNLGKWKFKFDKKYDTEMIWTKAPTVLRSIV